MDLVKEILALQEKAAKADVLQERLDSIAHTIGVHLGPTVEGVAPMSAKEWRVVAARIYNKAKGRLT